LIRASRAVTPLTSRRGSRTGSGATCTVTGVPTPSVTSVPQSVNARVHRRRVEGPFRPRPLGERDLHDPFRAVFPFPDFTLVRDPDFRNLRTVLHALVGRPHGFARPDAFSPPRSTRPHPPPTTHRSTGRTMLLGTKPPRAHHPLWRTAGMRTERRPCPGIEGYTRQGLGVHAYPQTRAVERRGVARVVQRPMFRHNEKETGGTSKRRQCWGKTDASGAFPSR